MEPDNNDSKYNLETLCIVKHPSRCCICTKDEFPDYTPGNRPGTLVNSPSSHWLLLVLHATEKRF